MKKTRTLILSLFITCLTFMSISAQLVISEIMYNPPESGVDSLEYVEIMNMGADLNIEGYQIDGFGVTFPSMMLPSGGFVVSAVNPEAMNTLFGVFCIQATGALSNGGETLSIIDDKGATLSSVSFENSDPWPSGPAGNGPSLELCENGDPTNPADYHASTNDTGVTINGSNFLGTPGTMNTTCGAVAPDATITAMNFSFSPKDITISVGETVLFMNGGGFHNINGTQATFSGNPESFGNGAASNDAWEYSYTFNVAGTYDFQCDPHAANGMAGTITVEGSMMDEYPDRDIADLTTLDADGVVDSLGVNCRVQGIVHGTNFRPEGLQFTLIDDNNNGIGIFSNNDDLGYVFNESDLITVTGTVAQFNGLTQIAINSVTLDGTSTVFTPTVVTSLDEESESQLVRIEDVSLVDPNQWSNSGSGFNVDVTDGTTSYTVRIDADTDIYGKNAPTGTFNITGLGGQFDNSAPYDEGYQLFPRYISDIDPYVPDGGGGEDFPVRTIGQVTSIDSEGVADSLGVGCTITGIVHGINVRPSGLQFTIIDDAGDGIGLFSGTEQFGYTVSEGDEITVEGTIGQFNGLTQISPSSLVFNSVKTAFDPTEVNTLNEDTESQVVKFSNTMTIVDLSQWLGDGSSFNVDVTDGTNTFVMRIDNDVELATMTPTSNIIELSGIGGQFDNSAPFLEGYQIFPRYADDVKFIVSTKSTVWLNERVIVYPNPSSENLTIETALEMNNYALYNMQGKLLMEGITNTLDVSLLLEGQYVLKVVTDEGIAVKKIMIRD